MAPHSVRYTQLGSLVRARRRNSFSAENPCENSWLRRRSANARRTLPHAATAPAAAGTWRALVKQACPPVVAGKGGFWNLAQLKTTLGAARQARAPPPEYAAPS